MKRREFLQDLSAVGASTLLPNHTSARASPPTLQTQRSSEDATMGRVAVAAIGSVGVEVLSALSGRLLYLKRSIAISTAPVVLLRAAANEKLLYGPHVASQFCKRFRGDFEEALDGADILFVVFCTSNLADSGSAEVIADVLRAKSIPTIAAVITSIWKEEEFPEEWISASFHALTNAANAIFPLATTSPMSAISLQKRKVDITNPAANAFERLYHGVVKPIYGRGFVTWSLEDIVSTLSQEGASAIGFGMASGKHAIEAATLRAIMSDSLGQRRLHSASVIFGHLEGGSELLKFRTVSTMMDIVRRVTDEHDESLLVFGATEANMPREHCQVTILASGIHML